VTTADDPVVRSHNTFREGVVAGVIGATGVALWFLAVDLVAAELFFTPIRLGMAFGSVFGVRLMADNPTAAFVGYTILHYAVFAVIGIAAAAIVHRSRDQPWILAGAFLAFIISQALIHGFIALLHQTELLEHLTWVLIAVGNLIGAGLIGWRFWQTHPGLGDRFDTALGEGR
jgi:hypothetical protein